MSDVCLGSLETWGNRDWGPFFCVKETDRATTFSSFLGFSPFNVHASLNLHPLLNCHFLIKFPMTNLAAGRFFHLVTFVISTLSASWQRLVCAGSERDPTKPVLQMLGFSCVMITFTVSARLFTFLGITTHTHTHTHTQDPKKDNRSYNFTNYKLCCCCHVFDYWLRFGLCIFPNFLY